MVATWLRSLIPIVRYSRDHDFGSVPEAETATGLLKDHLNRLLGGRHLKRRRKNAVPHHIYGGSHVKVHLSGNAQPIVL